MMRAAKFITSYIIDKNIAPMIAAGGLLCGKKHAEFILFYSGPQKKVRQKIIAKENSWSKKTYPFNWQIAGEEAKRLGAKRIDNASVFTYLMSDELNEELKSLINSKLSLKRKHEIKDETKKYLWDYVSDKFSRTPFKKAATLVCAAAPDSSFYAKEIDGILDNESLEIINERPAALFRAFRALGKAEVNRIMCVTALVEMRQYAQNNNDPQAWENYKRQRKYFVIAQAKENKKIKALPPKKRAKYAEIKRSIIKEFKNPSRSTKSNAPAQCLSVALCAV